MKTKPIPALVMLLAGFVTCIVGIFQGIEVKDFLKILFFVLLAFYVAGCVIKVIIDKNFQEMKEEDATEVEEPEEQEENAQEEKASENETEA